MLIKICILMIFVGLLYGRNILYIVHSLRFRITVLLKNCLKLAESINLIHLTITHQCNIKKK